MTTFTTTSKPAIHWDAPPPVDNTNPFFLNIGDGYNLLIATGYKLIIQTGTSETPWTTISKNSPVNY